MTMSISDALTPHLPSLRRFARVLCGSQESGDAYVVALLEAILENAAIYPDGLPPKIALYRVFLKIWNSVDANAFPSFNRRENGAARSLQTLTPKPRQAFLLLTLEGLKPGEIAAVLDCGVGEVGQLVAAADREIANQLDPASILIIEDEALTALDLEELVKSLGHHVVGMARTRAEALALARRHKPQLILSDIELADGSSGLDAVNEILGSFEAPVIFVTGHSEVLLTGARPEPAFLVAKPFNAETLKAVIGQALFFEVRSHAKFTGKTNGEQLAVEHRAR
jgi:DNA-directed RNA polymerase specialized sigma24 family protein/CheY-like chemotaxis protein